MADDFDDFLKIFFANEKFQKSHINYPIQGHISYICASNTKKNCEEYKIFANDPKEWEYLGYGYGTHKGVVYKKSNKCPDKLPEEKDCLYIELSQPETDFNLQLYFKKSVDSWDLIYIWYFEP